MEPASKTVIARPDFTRTQWLPDLHSPLVTLPPLKSCNQHEACMASAGARDNVHSTLGGDGASLPAATKGEAATESRLQGAMSN